MNPPRAAIASPRPFSFAAAIVLTTAVYACAVYANLAFAVADPADYRRVGEAARRWPSPPPRSEATVDNSSARVVESARSKRGEESFSFVRRWES